MLQKIVEQATPYPHDISREDLKVAMKENGAKDLYVIGNMMFAIDDYGTCAAGFRLGLSDFKLKCYNNRMFGIFNDN